MAPCQPTLLRLQALDCIWNVPEAFPDRLESAVAALEHVLGKAHAIFMYLDQSNIRN